jgi:hypothetical protein
MWVRFGYNLGEKKSLHRIISNIEAWKHVKKSRR